MAGPSAQMAKAKAAKGVKRMVRCYLCGHRLEVSARTLSTACPGCHTAIKVEDITVNSYLPVNDLQTCGRITITRRGRVAARRIQCGEGITCEGTMEGIVETDGDVQLGAKAMWKGKALQSRTLLIADGAKLNGQLVVPWVREETEPVRSEPKVTRPEAVEDVPAPPRTAARGAKVESRK